MRYFILSQDTQLKQAITLEGIHTHEKYIINKEQQKELNELSNVYVEGEEDAIYPDLIQYPVLLISERLKALFEIYEETMINKTTILTQLAYKKQEVYYLTLLDIIPCLSDKTAYLKNGWDDHVVLEKEKIGECNLFYVNTPNKYYLIASLELVEAILKRNFMGINIKEIEVI